MSDKKTYVLIVSEKFPTTHKRKGEKTFFLEKISNGNKIHTIRANYKYWKKIISQIKDRTAILSIRKWTGKPYNSSQKEILRLSRSNGVGIQKIQFTDSNIYIDERKSNVTIQQLAKNDGLYLEDFQEWFKKYPKEPMAIIHFTGFRYNQFYK